MAKYTITHSEKSKGWTSFWSFIPEFMLRLNNRFYTIKNGQLYIHNEDTGTPNQFYGVKYPSKIKTVINESSIDDKIFKTIVLESNKPWDIKASTNLSNSEIKQSEFNQRESRQFAYLRKNENTNDLHGNTAQGLGTIVSVTGLKINFLSVSNFVSVGDQLFRVNNTLNELIGTITDKDNASVTVDAIAAAPSNGFYCFSKKNPRFEGGEMRGYYMDIELENNDNEKVELFGVSSNVVKSYV